MIFKGKFNILKYNYINTDFFITFLLCKVTKIQ